MVSDPSCKLTPGFIQQFCSHATTRYGLCQICGAIISPGMLEHIDKTYRAGDCPWCSYAEPDEVYKGSPVDWMCKIHHEQCQFIRMYSINEDCKSYWPRKVEVNHAPE